MRGALEQAPGELERVVTHELTHAMTVQLRREGCRVAQLKASP